MHNTIIKLANENLWPRKLKNYKYNGKVHMHVHKQNSEMRIIYILLVEFMWQATVIKTDLFISCGSSNNFIFWVFFLVFFTCSYQRQDKKKMLLLTCQESWHLEKSRMHYFLVRVFYNKTWLTFYKIWDAFWSVDLIKTRYSILRNACA